jgi:bifunctional non-homologous end joining protein LigD
VARLLEQTHPDLVVSDMKKAVRTNRVFVDWSQNDQHKTTISVYSLRAREHPTVSTPVTWGEVEDALKKKDAARLVFEAIDVLGRVEKMGDLFDPVRNLEQTLPQLKGLGATSETTGESASPAARADARPPRVARSKTTTKVKSASAKRRKV